MRLKKTTKWSLSCTAFVLGVSTLAFPLLYFVAINVILIESTIFIEGMWIKVLYKIIYVSLLLCSALVFVKSILSVGKNIKDVFKILIGFAFFIISLLWYFETIIS